MPLFILWFAVSCLIVAVAPSLIWAKGILRWGRNKGRKESILPTISIIVAARNEEKTIQRCLQSLLALDYPTERTEICVVDDHSTDRTFEYIQSLARQDPDRIRVLHAPSEPVAVGPKKRALLQGIQHTAGELILFTDADCTVAPGWAKELVSYYDNMTGAVASAVLPRAQTRVAATLYRLERVLVALTSASAIGLGSPASVNGGSFSYRRSVFQQLGGLAHPEHPSGDDDLMAQAISRAGWKVKFAQGTESVVEDLRIPRLQRHLQAAARHQSTLRFYPIRWRILYGLTIASVPAFLALLAAALWFPSLTGWAIATLAIRICADGISVRQFSHNIHYPFSATDFLIAELFLPVYLMVRPLLMLRPGFSWHQRDYRRRRAADSQATV